MDNFSKEIWELNYKAPNENYIEDTWRRLASSCALVEKSDKRKKIEDQFYSILSDFKFIPGGRIMANLGVEGRDNTTLYNCFVYNPTPKEIYDIDSMEGIMEMLKNSSVILRTEGGLGIYVGWLRPKGSYINGIGARTPGVVKFLELWDKMSEIITAGSIIKVDENKNEKKKIRKGAMLACYPVWGPDIKDFITIKQTPNKLTKFNLSVGIYKDFINAVINNEKWDLVFPDTTFEKYKAEWDGDIYNWKEKGYPIKIYETVKARDLWNLIMESTYNRNEPGVIFLDNVNELNPLYYCEKIFTTNPCGEIPMPTSVCCLGSINLTKFVKIKDDKLIFDFDNYATTVKIAIRFLDNICDISNVPLPEYKKIIKEKRRIGLGNMGLGSLLMMFGIRYGSKESLSLIEDIYKCKCEAELLASAELGKEKGDFLLFDKEKYFNSKWWKNLNITPEIKKLIQDIGHMRNSHRSMNAPNGNTSIYAGVVSGGIEPVFSREYIRWSIVPEDELKNLKKLGFKFPDILKNEFYETEHLKFKYRGNEQILFGTFNNELYEYDKNRGLTKSINVIDYGWKFAKAFYPKDTLDILLQQNSFASTNDLTVQDHIQVLNIIAHYTDQSISKTVNIPNNYPFEKFKNLYMDAWKNGIKGITSYRSGTMTVVLEEKMKNEIIQNELEQLFNEAGDNIIKNVLKLPTEYYSKGYKIKDKNKKKWYINIAFADKFYQKPFAIFIHSNNNEGNEVTTEFIQAMEKLLIEKGIDKNLISEQIEKYAHQKNVTKIARIIGMALRHNVPIVDIIDVLDKFDIEISSLIFHLKKLLSKFIKDNTKVKSEKCPECGKTLVYKEGCKTCLSCFWSKC